ncbi:unnamed protein product [Nezara viridula]|uniref:Uncharacterized protein n=1 Tax=Nezara viridula TaxID=85310 RepID=A0A9P0MVS1_NEZVI|nr:unnamed protein product [Nezara viridula]
MLTFSLTVAPSYPPAISRAILCPVYLRSSAGHFVLREDKKAFSRPVPRICPCRTPLMVARLTDKAPYTQLSYRPSMTFCFPLLLPASLPERWGLPKCYAAKLRNGPVSEELQHPEFHGVPIPANLLTSVTLQAVTDVKRL